MLAIFSIAIGASLGALLRWQLGLLLNPLSTGPNAVSLLPGIPLGTLAANLLGGYLIGVCVAVFQAWPELDPNWRLVLVTGFLGGLTTFSTFSAEVVGMLLQQRVGLALVAAGMHLLGSLLMTWFGIRTATFFIAPSA
ncbi:fluoride efflux transporter CrcB [Curvibacter sp. CHRR-16]|uniref:fluoride efflux transporter CrcB n=1 Tax=Curvibacter sp. CHRR-16 TaxID=2835872 RepID=UPI001BDAB9BF|nr:fluoride efflux transporter CrcB [Curvibacter sp. CHRR-16]MBT0570778.1 fluoride efflux transporter CrcB [Curvibacter sp. CHRR-16]